MKTKTLKSKFTAQFHHWSRRLKAVLLTVVVCLTVFTFMYPNVEGGRIIAAGVTLSFSLLLVIILGGDIYSADDSPTPRSESAPHAGPHASQKSVRTSYFHDLGELENDSETGIQLAEEKILRKKAQEIAGQAHTEMELIFNAASPLCVINENHEIIRYNASFAELFQLKQHMPPPTPLKCCSLWDVDNCEPETCIIKKTAQTGKPTGEHEIHKTIGPEKRLTFLIKPVPYTGPDGKYKGIVASITDITERTEAVRRDKLHREQLLQADKMASLGVLVAGVAHEINNPNTFISLNVPLIKRVWHHLLPVLEHRYQQEGALDVGGMTFPEVCEMIPEVLSGMEDGAKRINQIVTSLKDFARKEPSLLNENVDISRVVASSLTLLNNIIRKSTDRFSVTYGPDIPTFRGNFQQIEQVVVNLVINACQSLPGKDKGVSITTTFNPDRQKVLLIIADEGNGIPEEIRKHIFDPFFTTKRDTGGTGLGLSIISNIIKTHNGDIDIASNVDTGTVFTVAFPV